MAGLIAFLLELGLSSEDFIQRPLQDPRQTVVYQASCALQAGFMTTSPVSGGELGNVAQQAHHGEGGAAPPRQVPPARLSMPHVETPWDPARH